MQEKSIGVNEKTPVHLSVCPVRSLTCMLAGSDPGVSYTFIICKTQKKSIGVNEKVSAHLAVCPVRSLTCIQAGSETETSYIIIICKKRNLSSPPCGRIFCWRQYGLADDFRAGCCEYRLAWKRRGAHPASVGSTENVRSNPIERLCRRGPRKVPQRSSAKRGNFTGQKPQALMQTPRGDFPRGAANIALRGKGAERTPRALVARRTVKGQGSRCVGVRDGSGNRAAGADANTPRGFPTGCCEYRLAARWWRCGESNPGPDDH